MITEKEYLLVSDKIKLREALDLILDCDLVPDGKKQKILALIVHEIADTNGQMEVESA